MYERKAHQATFFEDATLFGGVRLNPANRWVRMSRLIPWAVFEERYAALFPNPREGKPAKSARMAIGALIIKKRYGFSDEDVVEEIRENPYPQYFLGFAEYTNVRPFDPSAMTWFRERITTEMLTPDALSPKQLEYLAVIRELYEQQRGMYENNTHRVDDRIVSLHQPWVRPIARGKASAPVDLGAKVALSLSEGYARL